MFRHRRRQQQRHGERQRQLTFVRYGEDSFVQNMVANQTIVEAVPVLETAETGGRAVLVTPSIEPKRRRRRFCLCGGRDQAIEDQAHRPREPLPAGNNAILIAEVLDPVLVDPRNVSSTRASAQSRPTGGRPQTVSSPGHYGQSYRDRLGVLPRSPLVNDPRARIRCSEGMDRGGEDQSYLTSLAEILMMQGALAIGLPMDDYEGRSTNSSMKIPQEDLLPGYATTARPNEVSCKTYPTAPDHNRAVSEVTLPLELAGDQKLSLEDDGGDTDLGRQGPFLKEDYLDDKKLEELVADLENIHNRQLAQLKMETAMCKSILRSINDQPKGKSIQSLSSDSSELVNLMQEQYQALQLLKEPQAPSSSGLSPGGKRFPTTVGSDVAHSLQPYSNDDCDAVRNSPNTTPRSSNSFLKSRTLNHYTGHRKNNGAN
jgi:hypothetical protein